MRTTHSTNLYPILPVGMFQECHCRNPCLSLGHEVQTTSESFLGLYLLGVERARMIKEAVSRAAVPRIWKLPLPYFAWYFFLSASLWQEKSFPCLECKVFLVQNWLWCVMHTQPDHKSSIIWCWPGDDNVVTTSGSGTRLEDRVDVVFQAFWPCLYHLWDRQLCLSFPCSC